MLHRLQSKEGHEFYTTKEHIKLINEKDISTIPITTDDYWNESKQFSEADLQRLANPKALSRDQAEFLHVHEKLYHQPYKQMLKLSKLSILPSKFLKKTFHPPTSPSCVFGA